LVTFAAAICLVTFFVIISALLFNNFSLHTNKKKLDRNYIFQRWQHVANVKRKRREKRSFLANMWEISSILLEWMLRSV